MFAALVLAALFTQEGELELLRAEDVRVREAAELRLAESLDPAFLPTLRGLIAGECDLEVKGRLSGVAAAVSTRQADRLLSQGHLDEALRFLTGDAAEPDVDEVIHRLKQNVEAEIRTWFPEPPGICDCPRDIHDCAQEIRDRFGPWGAAVLIDLLGREEKDIPAACILAEMDDDIIPCLVRALQQGNAKLRREACSVLYELVAVHHKSLEDRDGLVAALRELAADPVADPDTRFRSQWLLDQGKGAP
ncbi:MAG: hypothetical protein JO332_11310 [Planctomycetaceae bacterium]|nr:hypothetical protein [Planctomycetaceae bacterium]